MVKRRGSLAVGLAVSVCAALAAAFDDPSRSAGSAPKTPLETALDDLPEKYRKGELANRCRRALADYQKHLESFRDEERRRFESGDTDPGAPAIRAIGNKAATFRTKRAPFDRTIDQLVKQLMRDSETELAERVTKAASQVGGIPDAKDAVKVGDVFDGYRWNPALDRRASIRLKVTSVNGNRFEGEIELNRHLKNHLRDKVAGEFNGITLRFKSVGAVQFGNHAKNDTWNYEGYVLGSRIVGEGQFQYHPNEQVPKHLRGKQHRGTFHLKK